MEACGYKNDRKKVILASSFLKDAALHRFQAAEKLNPRMEWEKFEKIMIESYKPLDSEERIREKLKNLRQSNNFNDYLNKFRIIINQVKSMKETDKKIYFMDGLEDST